MIRSLLIFLMFGALAASASQLTEEEHILRADLLTLLESEILPGDSNAILELGLRYLAYHRRTFSLPNPKTSESLCEIHLHADWSAKLDSVLAQAPFFTDKQRFAFLQFLVNEAELRHQFRLAHPR